MKNGNPLTKALVIFLFAPKGLVFLSPLLLAKKAGGGPLALLSALNMKFIGLTAFKIGLSLASFKSFQ